MLNFKYKAALLLTTLVMVGTTSCGELTTKNAKLVNGAYYLGISIGSDSNYFRFLQNSYFTVMDYSEIFAVDCMNEPGNWVFKYPDSRIKVISWKNCPLQSIYSCAAEVTDESKINLSFRFENSSVKAEVAITEDSKTDSTIVTTTCFIDANLGAPMFTVFGFATIPDAK